MEVFVYIDMGGRFVSFVMTLKLIWEMDTRYAMYKFTNTQAAKMGGKTYGFLVPEI